MGFYDIIMVVILMGAMLFGYWKGLAWQIASVAAVVVSYIAAVRFRDQVAQFVQAEPPFNRIAAMLIIFVGCSLVIWLAYAYVNKSLEKAELDGFNRQMGALVGAVTGILLCMVVTMFSVSLLGDTAHDSIHHSKFGPYVVRGISMVQAFVPEELEPSLNPHFENFREQLGHDLDDTNLHTVPGGSQYANDQYFNSGGQQPSYQVKGNWTTSPATQPAQNTYQNSGYQTNTYQSNSNQTQTGYGYQPAPSNQGTNYGPQPTPSQPQSSGLPPVEIKLDAETLWDGAGRWLKDTITSPNGN